MKNIKTIILVAISVSLILLTESCKKDEASEFENAEYSISTGDVSQLNGNFAVASGKLRMTSGKVSSYGHCWSTYQGATIETDDHTTFGPEGSTKEFSSELSGLEPGTFYYVRSYAKGSEVVYGNEIPFRTPTIQVDPLVIMEQSTSSVQLGAHVRVFSGAVGQYGFCYALHDNPSIYDSKTENFGLPENGYFNHSFNDFQSGVKYYVRAYAQADQMVYGPVMEVILDDVAFSVMYIEQTGSTSLKIQVKIEINGVNLEQFGICWSEETMPDLNDKHTQKGNLNHTVTFTTGIRDLEKNGTYYLRAYAQTPDTVRYSSEVSITLKYPHNIPDFPGNERINAPYFIIDDDIYIGFGEINKSVHEDFWKLDAEKDKWERKNDFPENISSGDYATNENGYVFYRYQSLTVKGYQYNSSNDSWTALPDLELNFYPKSLESFTYEGDIYLSMFNISADKRILWKLIDSGQNWQEVSSDYSNKVISKFAFVVNGKAYWAESTNDYTSVNFISYDFNTDTWAHVHNLNLYFEESLTFFTYNGQGYIKAWYSSVYRFDPAASDWLHMASIEEGDFLFPTIINYNNNLFIGLGGGNEKFYPYVPQELKSGSMQRKLEKSIMF